MSRDSIHKPMVARAFGGNLEVGLAWWRDMYDRVLAYSIRERSHMTSAAEGGGVSKC